MVSFCYTKPNTTFAFWTVDQVQIKQWRT